MTMGTKRLKVNESRNGHTGQVGAGVHELTDQSGTCYQIVGTLPKDLRLLDESKR